MTNLVNEAFAVLTVNEDPESTVLDLGSGTTGQRVHSVLVQPMLSGGALISQFKVQFYDGDPAGAGVAIGQPMWLCAQPPTGFVVDFQVSSGDLGMSITGYVSGTVVVYANAFYTSSGY